MQLYKQITTLARSTPSVIWQHNKIQKDHAHKIKSLVGTNITKCCEIQRCYSSVVENNEDKSIENKRYKEIVKEYSFKVPSFENK